MFRVNKFNLHLKLAAVNAFVEKYMTTQLFTTTRNFERIDKFKAKADVDGRSVGENFLF